MSEFEGTPEQYHILRAKEERMLRNQEKLRHYYSGGDDVLEQLIEHSGMFPDRLPAKNELQAWLIEARKNWRIQAEENGGVDLDEEAEE